MKLHNLTAFELHAAAILAGGMKFKPTAEGGYFMANKYGPSPFRAVESNGASTYWPCIHGWKALHKAIRTGKEADNSPNANPFDWAFWVNGFKIGPFDSGKLSMALSTWGKAKKGLLCDHPAAPGSVAASVIASTPSPVPPPPQPKPSYPVNLPAALDGEPVLDGDVASPKHGARRSVMVAVTSMYVLEELYMAVAALTVPTLTSDVPEAALAVHYRRLSFARRLVPYRKTFLRRIARNFFDFNVWASMQELHASGSGNGSRFSWSGSTTPTDYDPRSSLPGMSWAFRTKHGVVSHGGYGGERWARITDAGALFFKFRNLPLIFADHCVDLSHNSCLAWNKGIIFDNPSSSSEYLKVLDTKRAGSLLASTLSLKVNADVEAATREAVYLGIIPPPTASLTAEADPEVPFLKYGTATFTVKPGHDYTGSKRTILPEDKKEAQPVLDSGPAVAVSYPPKVKATAILPTLTPARA